MSLWGLRPSRWEEVVTFHTILDQCDYTYSCSLFVCTVRGGNLCPFTFPYGRPSEQTKYGIMIFVSVEPAYFSIFYLKMILPIFMLRMASHCVKYRLYALVCVQFNPGGYGDTFSGDSLKVCTVQKNVSTSKYKIMLKLEV